VHAARSRRRNSLGLVWTLLLTAFLLPAGRASLVAQEEARAGALTFVYWPGQQRAATALVEALDPLPLMPGLPEDILASGEILVILAPDPAAFDSLAPGVPDWSGGIAFPEGDEIVLPIFAARVGRRPMITVLRHELAHVALGRYLGSGVPRWFHEGYAQLASGSWNVRDAWTLRAAILLGKLPSLESLTLDFRGTRLDADQAYMLSYTIVEYMYRLGGSAGFTRLLERWRETGDLDAAMRRTYGITLGQFERMWRRDAGSRFGWLLLLAQTAVYWSVLTILLLVLGYWKKKRNRKKLEALEAAARARELALGIPDILGEETHRNAKIDGE
jgi:hypothetical protein